MNIEEIKELRLNVGAIFQDVSRYFQEYVQKLCVNCQDKLKLELSIIEELNDLIYKMYTGLDFEINNELIARSVSSLKTMIKLIDHNICNCATENLNTLKKHVDCILECFNN